MHDKLIIILYHNDLQCLKLHTKLLFKQYLHPVEILKRQCFITLGPAFTEPCVQIVYGHESIVSLNDQLEKPFLNTRRAKFVKNGTSCALMCDYSLNTKAECLMWTDRWWFVSPLGLSNKTVPASGTWILSTFSKKKKSTLMCVHLTCI